VSVKLAAPNITEAEIEAVVDVLRSGNLALGKYATAFEELAAHASGRRFAIACSSGTAALHMIVRALEIGPGDEVITTPFSFVASANCVLYERARPVFVDIEEGALGIDPELIDGAVSDATRAVIAVDVFGAPCRIDAIEAIATRRGWHLIEDSCEAIGSRLHGRPLGSFGTVGAFAFYPNKQITTGEGGMVVTDDEALAATVRSLRNQGRDQDGTWLRHVQLGYNYRLDEMSAALGYVQMRRADELRRGRERVAARYDAGLSDLAWLRLPTAPTGSEVDWFVFVVRLDQAVNRDRMIGQLAARGIPSRPYFAPLHLQPLYRRELGHREGDFPVTERVARGTLALPFSSVMEDDEVDQVVDELRRAAGEQGVT
jgi:perosamine synthetase